MPVVLLCPAGASLHELWVLAGRLQALGTVEQISSVRFVDCSFPSVPSEAPHIQLERWESMQDSEWQLRWAPSWSVQVAVEGSHYLQFTLMLRLFDFRVSGRIKMRMSQDMSTVSMSFLKMPKLRLRTSCAVSWGSVPLPLQTYIETVVQDEFQRWMRENAVLPNELQMHPQSFQPKHGAHRHGTPHSAARRCTATHTVPAPCRVLALHRAPAPPAARPEPTPTEHRM